MKLPYRMGEPFALPLGDGSVADAIVRDVGHRVVTIEAGGSRLRVFDSALVLRRWRPSSAQRPSTTVLRAFVQADNVVVSPARAERLFAEAFGIAQFSVDPLRIFEVPGAPSEAWFARLPHDASLAWNVALGEHASDLLKSWLQSHAQAYVRVGGAAIAQLSVLARTPIANITLAAPIERATFAQSFPAVRRLTVDAEIDARAIANAFPALRSLRFGDGAKHVDAAALAALTSLGELDLAHVRVERIDAIEQCAGLRALRVAHIDGLRSIDAITGLRLRTLAIEEQPQLASARELRRVLALEQLEVRGMWHWTIEECAWLFELPSLVRVAVDIGGRRKNLELYARARWAYPWPAFSDARVTSVAPLERSG